MLHKRLDCRRSRITTCGNGLTWQEDDLDSSGTRPAAFTLCHMCQSGQTSRPNCSMTHKPPKTRGHRVLPRLAVSKWGRVAEVLRLKVTLVAMAAPFRSVSGSYQRLLNLSELWIHLNHLHIPVQHGLLTLHNMFVWNHCNYTFLLTFFTYFQQSLITILWYSYLLQ